MAEGITVRPGLAVLAERLPDSLAGARVGLVAHAASVVSIDGARRHAVELLSSLPGLSLVRLFGPEHGLYGAAHEGQAVDDGTDEASGLPVVSLYGGRRAPEPEQLQDLDALLFDLQDVGVRAYTYLSTLKACLEACASAGIQLVVLDRPNPLGRARFGPRPEPGYASFVGCFDLPFGHGRTLGELARHIAAELGIPRAVQVAPMRSWQGQPWRQTGLPWVPPSPNLPDLESVDLYPATVFIEGSNLSEGRGTPLPFRQVGAPWLDGALLAEALNDHGLPGIRFAPARFTPSRSKHAGQEVAGVQLELLDARAFRPLQTAFALLVEARRQDPESFAWTGKDRPFLDLLFGSDKLRGAVEGEMGEDEFAGWMESCYCEP
ncbi:MAG TPA: DUF1343 domain-containing protein [Trueperaceae bacterium]